MRDLEHTLLNDSTKDLEKGWASRDLLTPTLVAFPKESGILRIGAANERRWFARRVNLTPDPGSRPKFSLDCGQESNLISARF
jgi:hypothetical protein